MFPTWEVILAESLMEQDKYCTGYQVSETNHVLPRSLSGFRFHFCFCTELSSPLFGLWAANLVQLLL